MKIHAIVVTYNRKQLLLRCIFAILKQTRRPDKILIVDNASTDGTLETLNHHELLARDDIEILQLPENTGGAGGFSSGIQSSFENKADWVWVMDDDAIPHEDALANLLDRELDPSNLYGSVAVFHDDLSWPMRSRNHGAKTTIYKISEAPKQTEVDFIPFLGLLISKKLVSKIGIPDAGFFIAADDVDYCLRARRNGAKIFLVASSRIQHPLSERNKIWIPFRFFYSLRLPPWKRYYDVRNRFFVAKNHYGLALYYSTIPGSFLRLIVTLIHEPQRIQQCKAFFAGMLDGLTDKKGRRHEKWGLKP